MPTITIAPVATRPLMPVLAALSGAHLLNDLIQSMIPALYPLIKDAYQLEFARIGLITLAFQVTSSILQPLLGHAMDRRPWPYAMVAGMGATLLGLLGLSFATSYAMVLSLRHWSGSDRPFSIPKLRAWRGTPLRVSRGSPKVYFRSEGMPATRSARCWPLRWSFRGGSLVCPGSPVWRSSPWR